MQTLLPLRLPIPDAPPPIPVGSIVGAGRWPMKHAHPDCWGDPWTGVVMAIDDVEVWDGSIALGHSPNQLEVSAHVRRCLAQGLLKDKVPVRWNFGKIMWESPEQLRSAEEDRAEFERERAAAR